MASRLQDVITRGLAASRPLATAVAPGTLYYSTDTAATDRSNGTTWETYSDAAGGGITQLTGDVTAGPGSVSQVATIANNAVTTVKILNDAVTYAKMQNVTAPSLILGRKSSGAGDIEELPISDILDFLGAVSHGDIVYRDSGSWVLLPAGTTGKYLKTQGPGADPIWDTPSGGGSTPTGTGFRHIITGVEDAASKLVDTADINNDQVTFAKVQNIETNKLLGRGTASSGDIEEITLGTNLSLSGTTLNAASGGGGAGWTFISSAAASGSAVNFTGLSAYKEILIVMKAVTVSGGAIRQLLVSTDNGATYKNASGDYVTMDSLGGVTNGTYLAFDNGNDAGAHDGWLRIDLFNDTNSPLKPVRTAYPITNTVQAVNLSSALDAIRARPHTSTFSGGNFYLFGK